MSEMGQKPSPSVEALTSWADFFDEIVDDVRREMGPKPAAAFACAAAEIRKGRDELLSKDKALASANEGDGSWTAWLVEREYKGRTEYVSGEDNEFGMWRWTADPLDALHLCRRRDADRIAGECDDCRITEHRFVG